MWVRRVADYYTRELLTLGIICTTVAFIYLPASEYRILIPDLHPMQHCRLSDISSKCLYYILSFSQKGPYYNIRICLLVLFIRVPTKSFHENTSRQVLFIQSTIIQDDFDLCIYYTVSFIREYLTIIQPNNNVFNSFVYILNPAVRKKNNKIINCWDKKNVGYVLLLYG